METVRPTASVLNEQSSHKMTVAVVIPSYRVKDHILSVISRIGPSVSKIYVVDDRCPIQSGEFVVKNCTDPRVDVIFNQKNLGVGGATMAGYQQALNDGIDIVVKIDGDGQMDPALIPAFIKPIEQGIADYTKGNRFFSLENLEGMPPLRMLGNTALSFVSKVASGYWNVMDPTNGYTAIHAAALSSLSLHKIDRGYFFESDMLFRLNTIRAVVHEVPMKAVYGNEKSSLSILKVLRQFPKRYISRLLKRLGYNYFLRDFNACSVEILAGLGMLIFGVIYGAYHWYHAAVTQTNTPTGTIMLAVLPIILGVQMLLEAVTLDIMNVPQVPLQNLMMNRILKRKS
jgi:dolichol-phosphate mannosyltransferase